MMCRMKTKRQREKRMLCMLRRPEGGAKATEVRRKLGISEQTFCTWRRKKARVKKSKSSGFRVDFVA